MKESEERLVEISHDAYQRGFERGTADRFSRVGRNPEPLSGEWAGDSIPELLGDLIHLGERVADEGFRSDADTNPNDVGDWFCDVYEQGYEDGFYADQGEEE